MLNLLQDLNDFEGKKEKNSYEQTMYVSTVNLLLKKASTNEYSSILLLLYYRRNSPCTVEFFVILDSNILFLQYCYDINEDAFYYV